jgi:hypothetical protein
MVSDHHGKNRVRNEVLTAQFAQVQHHRLSMFQSLFPAQLREAKKLAVMANYLFKGYPIRTERIAVTAPYDVHTTTVICGVD